MLRRTAFAWAVSIPRSVWDPAHYNPNWPDSYSNDIADRRQWPAKKWSIGLEPRTPREWLRFSYRNLAYAYNGALRACHTFPEMLIYYREAKLRGVRLDVDTLNILLTRAARYEHIHVDDIFMLFDELTDLGARPDVSSVETLHTVLEHSASKPFEWREARRRQLVELYNRLAMEEINRLAPHKVDALLAQQLARIRKNLQQLQASLSPSVYRRYFAVIDNAETLLREVHNFLWEFVSPDHPALDIASLQKRIPFVASVMRRPSLKTDPTTLKPTDFEDTDVCAVLLAAVERCVDGEFHDARQVSERRMYLSLLTMLTSSGVLYTADLVAQMMDIIKYSRLADRREEDAMRLLRYALRGSSASDDEAYRNLWQQVERVVDPRVVGRYLSCRDPWSPMQFCHDDQLAFRSFPAGQLVSSTASTSPTGAPAEDNGGGVSRATSSEVTDFDSAQHEGAPRRRLTELRTAEGLQLRWENVKALIDKTQVLEVAADGPLGSGGGTHMEVFTGLTVFLRSVATGQRYGPLATVMATQAVGDGVPHEAGTTGLFADDLALDVWECLFACLKEAHADMERFIAAHDGVEPDFECWEAMLIVLRCLMDRCVLHTQQHGKEAGGGAAERLFTEAAAMRHTLLEESLTRFDGRMRILWLQEA